MILLGIAHVSFTLQNHFEFTIDVFWFASAPVVIILAGFLNTAMLRSDDAVIRFLCVFTNVLLAAMFAAASFLFSEPQVYIGLLIFSGPAVIAALNGER